MSTYHLTIVEKEHDQQTDLIFYRAYYSNGFREIDEVFELNAAIPTIIIK